MQIICFKLWDYFITKQNSGLSLGGLYSELGKYFSGFPVSLVVFSQLLAMLATEILQVNCVVK